MTCGIVGGYSILKKNAYSFGIQLSSPDYNWGKGA
jgi:hypothetical protein